jgi:hypothetical protein
MKTNLIALAGEAGSGKNIIADMICSLHPKFEQRAFAYKVKLMASILLGVPVEKFEDREFKKSMLGSEWDYLNVREFLQKLGTDGLRDGLHVNVWVNALFADYRKPGVCVNLRLLQGVEINGKSMYPEDILKIFHNQSSSWSEFHKEYGLDKDAIVPMDHSNWIITDTRFPNELEEVKFRGGVTIKLTREGDLESDHESETALENAEFDYVLDNTGNLDQAFDAVKLLMDRLE